MGTNLVEKIETHESDDIMSFDKMFYHAGMRSTVNGFDHRQKVQKLFRFQRICYYFEARLVEHKIWSDRLTESRDLDLALNLICQISLDHVRLLYGLQGIDLVCAFPSNLSTNLMILGVDGKFNFCAGLIFNQLGGDVFEICHSCQRKKRCKRRYAPRKGTRVRC